MYLPFEFKNMNEVLHRTVYHFIASAAVSREWFFIHVSACMSFIVFQQRAQLEWESFHQRYTSQKSRRKPKKEQGEHLALLTRQSSRMSFGPKRLWRNLHASNLATFVCWIPVNCEVPVLFLNKVEKMSNSGQKMTLAVK